MKEAVHKLVAEWDESLHMGGSTYWKVEDLTNPRTFFQHLPKVFPDGMTLLIEGLEIGLSAKSLYEEFPAIIKMKVACDTIDPTPDSYHVSFCADFASRLCQLIDSQGLAAALHHFKGYSGSEILFTFHDAFDGELVLSSSLDEKAVREFASGLGRTPELTRFAFDLREHLQAIDRAMNPPWWRRALNFLEGKSA